jgi:hypothetical protein
MGIQNPKPKTKKNNITPFTLLARNLWIKVSKYLSNASEKDYSVYSGCVWWDVAAG